MKFRTVEIPEKIQHHETDDEPVIKDYLPESPSRSEVITVNGVTLVNLKTEEKREAALNTKIKDGDLIVFSRGVRC